MVINFDRNPNRSTDEKLDSLIISIQLALNEIENSLHDMDKRLADMQKEIDEMGA